MSQRCYWYFDSSRERTKSWMRTASSTLIYPTSSTAEIRNETYIASKPTLQAPGFATAIDLASGELFEYTDITVGFERPSYLGLERFYEFDSDNVVILREANGSIPTYEIGSSGVWHRQLTSEQASRLEVLSLRHRKELEQKGISLNAPKGYSRSMSSGSQARQTPKPH